MNHNTNETQTQQQSSIITSAAALIAAYRRGERTFAYSVRLPYGADLRGADLRGADLRGADLRGADLRGADLRHADLAGADLAGADLRRADLAGADLRHADLRHADLADADLTGANLAGANLTGANLWGANLTGAKNIPPSCHDVLAELLCQAAGEDVRRRAFAGLLLISRDWCWRDYQRMREAGTWPEEIVAWVGETLGAYDSLAPYLRRYGWLSRESGADGAATEAPAKEGGAE